MGFNWKNWNSLSDIGRKIMPEDLNSWSDIKENPGRALLHYGAPVVGDQVLDIYDQTQEREPRSYDAQNFAAAIPRDEYAAWRKTYEPVIGEYASLLNPARVREQADSAYRRAGRAFESATVAGNQDMQRYGVSLTPRQQEALSRIRSLAKATASNAAYNDTLQQAQAGRVAGLDFMSSLGRNLAQQAYGLSNVAAGMEINRNDTNTRLKQENAQGWANLGLNIGLAAIP